MIYDKILKPIFFKTNPEKIHNFFLVFGNFLGKTSLTRKMVEMFCYYENPMLKQNILGIDFPNPVGLAAGFDKDAQLTQILPYVGFGFMEIGSITNLPYKGNPKPRLGRLTKDHSIVVNYGLKNRGAKVLFQNLHGQKILIPLGISIAKTNNPEITGDNAIDDYFDGFRTMYPLATYMTINVSCPNSPDGKTFAQPEILEKLLTKLSEFRIEKPVFLKIKPDYTYEQVDKLIEVVSKYPFIKGFISGNLTTDRSNLKTDEKIQRKYIAGGLSGAPTREKSTKLIKYLYKKAGDKHVIIGTGGVFNAQHAYDKIKAGASLIQLITGMIYNGPTVIKQINSGLVELLKKDGYNHISEAIGKDVDK